MFVSFKPHSVLSPYSIRFNGTRVWILWPQEKNLLVRIAMCAALVYTS